MLPWWYKTENYGKFWRMDNGKYPYTILFYEKDNDKYSCKDKFPLTLADGTIVTKDEFVTIVKVAFEQLNTLNLGISFDCAGFDVTDKEYVSFDMKDGVNAITYFWNYKWGGLAGPMSKNGFGIKADLIDKGRREWYIGVIRHELTHCLGFAHKDDKFKNLKTSPVITGLNGKGEFTADTIHGFKTVYGMPAKYTIAGQVEDYGQYQYDYIEAFLVNWQTRELCYQSPIDINGYFEFRLDIPIRQFKVFVLGKEKGKYYRFGKIIKPYKMNSVGKKIEASVKMVNSAANLEDVQGVTKIRLV